VKRIRNNFARGRAAGVSLIEVTAAVLLVSIMLAAAMRSVAVSKLVDYKSAQVARGKLLAQGLLAQILELPYQDPLVVTVTLGPDAANGETSPANYNDVDDYNGWTESPPKNRDQTNISSDLSGWTRSVVVEWVSPSNLTGAALLSESHCKRITVTVSYNGTKVATMVGIRTDAP
jgi:hypothetical protein